MSFIGSTNLNASYDKTGSTAGTGPGMPFTHRPSYYKAQDENRPEREAAREKLEETEPKLESSSEDEDLKRDREVLNLARKYSTHSMGDMGNPFEAEKDSQLDPWSPNFNSRAWTRALLKLEQADQEHYKPRTAGFAFRDLHVFGYGKDTDYQKSVGNVLLEAVGAVRGLLGHKGRKIDILQGLDGVVHDGEMLVVLGPPGSGCSTFLKTVSGETHGFYIDDKSYLNYQGISPKRMHKDFRGEAIYTAEVDVHFPQLSVGDTLGFAAKARAPQHIPGGISRTDYARFTRDAIMAQFGITHTVNTRVGNDFVRGVSGGERKRVTIAEAALSGAPLQCWDNSTRGLDSANAIEFCKTLRTSTELRGSTAAVAIYQSPQSAYDIFDKVLVLYEGRQIFFGRADAGKKFFENLGFWCPERQTDPDFLTSMTSPQERVVRDGFEGKAPRTPDEFAAAWKASPEYAALQKEIDLYDEKYKIDGEWLQKFQESRRNQQSKAQRVKSPYTLSYAGQVKLCLERGFQRLKGDPSLTFTQLFGNFIMALIIGSVFYNLQPTADSFFSRGALLFFAVLLNAFGAALEILTLYAQRPIVEKQSRYAFYHPSAEAVASMLTDMPYKIMNAIVFNLALYFLSNLRREPGAFFFYLLTTFTLTLVMSMLFRFIASVSRTLSQALAPTAILILGIVIYTGFAIPVPNMRGWARWINYLDPVAYGFESLMINEFGAREFNCDNMLIPQAPQPGIYQLQYQTCSSVGSTPGSNVVLGTAFIESSYNYDLGNKWRNYGIMWAFLVGLCALYLVATEFVTAKKSKGEVLLFRRGHLPAQLTKKNAVDEESGAVDQRSHQLEKLHTQASKIIERQTAIFHWQDICYDIKIKGEPRRILDHVDGWVKPGTLTALMGVSGAGKTTLLDVLATRTTMGVITGEALVDGRQRDSSFQRKTGYVQQQDLHLETTTVREALNFSALLRQPAHVPKQEKLDYVNDVIKLLDMQEYADAVVGVPGEGLNVEQRKRLTIGVELAAKPQLLLFLDEPTSGLDSQTSWAILDLLEKLQKNGQAILCTIHQPSAMLFQRFDRLLFLAKGGKTVYFGEVGKNSEILSKYFEKNGAHPCPPDANPAEWMLEVIGAAPGSHSDIDWPAVWNDSQERTSVRQHLAELKEKRPQETQPASTENDKASYREFAAPFWFQLWEVQKRVFQQYWRTPSYIYSKFALVIFSALFIGFSFFNVGTSQQELQNQLFAVFMLFTIFGQLTQQIMPHFVTQRSLYEARERPSKAYSWKAFMLSNLFVEIPWNTVCATLFFFCWYYPIGLVKNAEASDSVHERGVLMWLIVLTFFWFTSTFAHMMVAAMADAETAGNIGNLLFSLSLIFCGVLAGPNVFPRFWIFMYRVSPFTYLVQSILATGLRGNTVTCASNEYINIRPPPGDTCGQYLSAFASGTGGNIINPNAMSPENCSYCALSTTDQFLQAVNVEPTQMWRNFALIFPYIVFNIAMATFLYWFFRVPKSTVHRKRKEQDE